jgi:4-amino-4-deoxy-L-arabinose transferase-like glycosyltransferase
MTANYHDWRSFPERAGSIGWLILGFVLLRLLLAAVVPLLPQEAYYWTWSRYPDWSYFDHPPLASYSIALTTALLGQTAFGIKSAAVLWSLGWNILWARLILDMYGDRKLAFWSLLALNLTVVYEVLGFGPTPDAPLLFAWVGTIWAVWRLSATGDGRWWFVAGAFMGLAWLGKYSGALLGPIVLLYLLTTPRLRFWLARPHPYLAFILAILIFAPVLIWNSQHEWVSLAFQSSRRMGEMGGFKPQYFLMLAAQQFLIVTPYLFVLSIAALVRESRKWFSRGLDDPARLLLISGAVPLLLFTAFSFRSIVKINWLAPAFWPLIILGIRHLLAQDGRERGMVRGLASSAALLAIGAAIAVIPNLPVPGDLNSWSGYKAAAAHVDRLESSLKAEGKKSFIFSPHYKSSSLIWFYRAGQGRTYAQDIYGEKALEYDFFPDDRDLKGATGILVISDQKQSTLDLDRLNPYFDSIDLVDVVETASSGKVVRRIEIYQGTNYKGRPGRAPIAVN